MKYHNVDPRQISIIELRPRTVVELFSEPFFYGDRRVIENISLGDSRFVDIGCKVEHHWKGFVRSMKIWDYDYYYNTFKRIRYCNQNSDCGEWEYCLCPGGQYDPSWCPRKKKRCMHVSNFLHAKRKSIQMEDTVDVNCMINEMKMMGRYVPFRNIKKIGNKCWYQYP